MTLPETMHGLLLVGHGTRSDVGAEQFLEVAARVAKLRAELIVEPAFLELRQPDIATAVRRLSERGCSSFVAVPLLLFAAGHAKQDIPQAIDQAARQFPGRTVPWRLAGHLGNDPLIVQLSGNRYFDAVYERLNMYASQTCLLLVGRGSSDAEASDEMRRLAALRLQQPFTRDTAAEVRVAFVAKAEPVLADELKRIAATDYLRVVVQPHLLFEGEVAESIRRDVGAIRTRSPTKEWIVTGVLASPPGERDDGSELLGHLVLARFEDAEDALKQRQR